MRFILMFEIEHDAVILVDRAAKAANELWVETSIEADVAIDDNDAAAQDVSSN